MFCGLPLRIAVSIIVEADLGIMKGSCLENFLFFFPLPQVSPHLNLQFLITNQMFFKRLTFRNLFTNSFQIQSQEENLNSTKIISKTSSNLLSLLMVLSFLSDFYNEEKED
jgi:hypothetical protein